MNYDARLPALSYDETTTQENQAASPNVQAGALSPTDSFYQQLIASTR
ncbi:MAG: hypothetical protein WCF84_20485 [Anaerolineae bacterium]